MVKNECASSFHISYELFIRCLLSNVIVCLAENTDMQTMKWLSKAWNMKMSAPEGFPFSLMPRCSCKLSPWRPLGQARPEQVTQHPSSIQPPVGGEHSSRAHTISWRPFTVSICQTSTHLIFFWRGLGSSTGALRQWAAGPGWTLLLCSLGAYIYSYVYGNMF